MLDIALEASFIDDQQDFEDYIKACRKSLVKN